MKTKFFTTLIVFGALALTACGTSTASASGKGGNASGSAKHTHVAAEGAPWQSDENQHWKDCKDNDGGKADLKNHSWVDDEARASENVDATCSDPGKRFEKCSVCGRTRERTIPTLEHNYGPDEESGWADKAGETECGTQAHQTRKCLNCDHVEERNNGLVQHKWVDSTEALPTGDSGYKLVKCSACQAEGLMISAKTATLSGSAKSGCPEDCIKLGSDGNSFSQVVVITAAKTGKFYLHGTMDYWYEGSNQNQEKTYYSQNNSHTDATNKVGNFKLEVGADADHLAEIELPDNKELCYGDLFPRTVGFQVSNHDWSIIGDAPVGTGALAAGSNLVKFTRVDSYNLAVHDILLVFDAQA